MEEQKPRPERAEWSEDRFYRQVGEFVISFQWLEDKLRQIGAFVIDPAKPSVGQRKLGRLNFGPMCKEAWRLFLGALPECNLPSELESDFKESVQHYAERLEKVRQKRNTFIHSAYVELKAGREVVGILRDDPSPPVDETTGQPQVDQEIMTDASFSALMVEMGLIAMFLGRCHLQLVHRYRVPPSMLAPRRSDGD